MDRYWARAEAERGGGLSEGAITRSGLVALGHENPELIPLFWLDLGGGGCAESPQTR